MRAAVLCLFLLGLVAVRAADPACYDINYNCAAAGGACNLKGVDGTNSVTYTTCSNNQVCNITDLSALTGTCATLQTAGQDCSASLRCAAGLACNGTVCTPLSIVGQDAMCDGLTKVCQTDMYCNFGINSTCKMRANAGDECTALVLCMPGNVCSGGKCVAGYSQAVDATCASNPECDAGLFCNAGKCAKPISASGKACTATDSSACVTGEFCVAECDGLNLKYSCQAPSGNSQSLKDNFIAYGKCQLANKMNICSATSTCQNCQKEACAYTPATLGIKDKCSNGVCAVTGASTTVVASLFLLIVALFVSL